MLLAAMTIIRMNLKITQAIFLFNYSSLQIIVTGSGANLCWALGGIICNFTPIFPIFNIGGMNFDQDFFQVSKLSEDLKKKRSSPEMEHFFSPNSCTDLRSDAHQSQIIGGDAGEDHSQIVGGIQSNY